MALKASFFYLSFAVFLGLKLILTNWSWNYRKFLLSVLAGSQTDRRVLRMCYRVRVAVCCRPTRRYRTVVPSMCTETHQYRFGSFPMVFLPDLCRPFWKEQGNRCVDIHQVTFETSLGTSHARDRYTTRTLILQDKLTSRPHRVICGAETDRSIARLLPLHRLAGTRRTRCTTCHVTGRSCAIVHRDGGGGLSQRHVIGHR